MRGLVDPTVKFNSTEWYAAVAAVEGQGEPNRETAKILGLILAEKAKTANKLAQDLISRRQSSQTFYRFGTLAILNEYYLSPGHNLAQIIDINTLKNTPNGNIISRIKRVP